VNLQGRKFQSARAGGFPGFCVFRGKEELEMIRQEAYLSADLHTGTMKIKRQSAFKAPQLDRNWFDNWAKEIEKQNGKTYDRITVKTALGRTQVWGINTHLRDAETLIIFPGARTSVLFWDFENGLKELGEGYRIFMVETNGLPNLSDGDTPDIKGNGYGEWASEVMAQLSVNKAFVAGASFGGLICMKLCLVAPEKVKAAFLLNPGCLQPFSTSVKNLWYNLLPIFAPSRGNVINFLDKAVFCKPHHQLSPASEKLLVDYEVFALTRYKDKTQKPYYMNEELRGVNTPTFLFEGDQDLLFPFRKSIYNAKSKLPGLKEVVVFPNVGHGIETYPQAIRTLGEWLGKLKT
jgi:pimeloyl-ACP methyl ester carboxylesterase